MGCGKCMRGAALLAAVCWFDHVSAAGFQIRENSVESLGRAFAGTVAVPGDLALIANNPAAMLTLDEHATLVAITVLDADSSFDGGGNDALGRPLTGGDGGDPGGPAAVPATFYAAPALGRWRWGVSLTAPFGLATEYDDAWVGRYDAIESGMKTINVGFALSYALSETFSLGGALAAQYADARLSNDVDFGAILAARGAPGFSPQSADGRAKIRGDDFGFGVTLGAYWRATPHTDFGVSFKSAIDQTLEGDADFTVPGNVAGVLAVIGSTAFQDTDFRAELDTPWVATIGFSHRIGERFMLAADASRTGWSRFSRILVEYDNPAQPETLITQGWKDTWYVALGGDWKYNDAWTLRVGTAWDETPTVDAFRSPRVPDSDRTWLALGASYAPSAHWRVDLGYAHLFADDTPIDRRAATGSTLTGEFEFGADVLGASLHYRF